MSDLQQRAAKDHGPGGLAPLPDEILNLLTTVDASPRLVVHLRLVRSVAEQLVAAVMVTFPELTIDRAAVVFGAATHDIGKAVHRGELSAPGREHEAAGEKLLLDHGYAPELARFARCTATCPDPRRQSTTISSRSPTPCGKARAGGNSKTSPCRSSRNSPAGNDGTSSQNWIGSSKNWPRMPMSGLLFRTRTRLMGEIRCLSTSP